jgi:hypothetical protein
MNDLPGASRARETAVTVAVSVVQRAAVTGGAVALAVMALFASADRLFPSDTPMLVSYLFVPVLYLTAAALAILLALPGPRPAFLLANSLSAGLGVAVINSSRPADINDATRVTWFILTLGVTGGSLAIGTLGYGLAREMIRRQPHSHRQSRR